MKKSILAVAIAIVIGFISAVAICLQTLSTQTVSSFSDGSMRVVIDAGHGGIDGGVSGVQTGVKESSLNLEISMLLKEKLEEFGFEVTLTRKTEAGLYGTTAKGFKKRDMQRRKEIIEEADPALILSVHQNLYASSAQRGGQVFYSSQSVGSERLAELLQARLNGLYAKDGGRGRKKQRGEFFMLECYPCPSVIVECGFLSNPRDEVLLQQESWQKQLTAVLAAGVVAYFAEMTA